MQHARGYTEGHRTITGVRLDILGLISTERMQVTVTRAAPLPTTQKKGAGQSLIKDDAMTSRYGGNSWWRKSGLGTKDKWDRDIARTQRDDMDDLVDLVLFALSLSLFSSFASFTDSSSSSFDAFRIYSTVYFTVVKCDRISYGISSKAGKYSNGAQKLFL